MTKISTCIFLNRGHKGLKNKLRNRTDAFLENEKDASRDNARAPMQWDTAAYAGFSTSKPWLTVNENYREDVNVVSQSEDAYSVLNYFKRMVQIRKEHLALVYGEYKLLHEKHEDIYAYIRVMGDLSYLVMLNFSTKRTTVNLDDLQFKKAKLLISKDDVRSRNGKIFELYPYQA